MLNKKTIQEQIKKLNNIKVKDYILEYQHSGIRTFATILLSIFCVFPIVYNMIYNVYDKINLPDTKVTSAQLINYNQNWFYIMFFLGFILLFLSSYQFLSLHYRTRLKDVLRFSWMKDRWLPCCLFLLLIWSILSALCSSNPLRSFVGDRYLRDGIITFCIFGLIFLISFLPSEKQMKTICEVMVIVGAITGYMIVLGKDYASILFFKSGHIKNGIFANSNHYGYFLSICLPLLVGLIINDKSKNIPFNILRILEFWLVTNAVLASRSRGCLIAVIIAMIGWNIYVFCLCKSKCINMIIIDIIFLITMLVLNTDNSIFIHFANIGSDIKQAIDSGAEDDISKIGSSRIGLWKGAIEMSFEKPIFGYGPDNVFIINGSSMADKPHNEFLEILASMGYPALILYLAAIIGHMVHFFKNIKKVSVFEVMIFSAICSYLVSSIFGVVVFYTKPYFYLMLGFSYILLRRHPDVKPLFKKKAKLNEKNVQGEDNQEKDIQNAEIVADEHEDAEVIVQSPLS